MKKTVLLYLALMMPGMAYSAGVDFRREIDSAVKVNDFDKVARIVSTAKMEKYFPGELEEIPSCKKVQSILDGNWLKRLDETGDSALKNIKSNTEALFGVYPQLRNDKNINIQMAYDLLMLTYKYPPICFCSPLKGFETYCQSKVDVIQARKKMEASQAELQRVLNRPAGR